MATNQAGVGLLIALALLFAPVATGAQPAKPKSDKTEAKAGADKSGAPGTDEDADDDDDDDDDDGIIPGDSGASPGGDADSGLSDICKIDPSQCPTINMEKAAARELQAEMYAVQQIYALRVRRVEINPYVALTMNDQFVAHNGIGAGINYYILNWLGVGANANIYHGMNSESDFNFETSRAARIGMPITEYSWNVNGNVLFVPAYGKFAGFQDFIFHWDFYVLVGAGAISTRPIAVVDPDNRTFDFKPKFTFGAGGGIRIFFNRWIAAMLEVRDYIFWDQLENPSVPPNYVDAQKEDNWLAPDASLTNNVQAQLGISIFLPFTWEYRLPK